MSDPTKLKPGLRNCLACNAEGKIPTAPILCRGLCARHYQQFVRGKLGSTRPLTTPGEATVINFAITKSDKARVERGARIMGESISAYARRCLLERLDEYDRKGL